VDYINPGRASPRPEPIVQDIARVQKSGAYGAAAEHASRACPWLWVAKPRG